MWAPALARSAVLAARTTSGDLIRIPRNIVLGIAVTPVMQKNLVLQNLATAYVAASRNLIVAAGGPAVIVLAPMPERKPA